MRADRTITGGGGLLCYIRDTLVFEKLYKKSKEGTEVAAFRVRLDKKNWVQLVNVYVPPENSVGQIINFCPDIILAQESSIICGDFNGHSVLWDESQPPDSRGERIINWLIDSDLEVLNNGSPTRVSRITGNGSAPDISLCGRKWSGKCNWTVGEDIGGSDHLPLIITVSNSVQHQSVFGRKARWKSQGVDWSKFQEEVEKNISKVAGEEESLTKRVATLANVLKDAATTHVGKAKPGKRTKPWMKPSVRQAIRKRNGLRRKIATKRREWLEACQEAREEISKAKEDSWKEILSDAINDVDEKKVWSFIKSLNGTPESNSPNEVLKHGGKCITSNRKKADLFASHYASVSSHSFNKEERNLNRRYKKVLGSSSVDGESCKKFSMRDLKRAIAKMKPKGAPGPDDLPPSFFKALGEKALEVLLHIYNTSFEAGFCPQIWRNATIIPLLKQGKSPSELESFRPVSLTSVMVKILERMVADRLIRMAEKEGWFSHLQAGFRKGRSCEDQILRLSQAIEDGFQKKPMNRSVLVLLDFSKAYDMVWKERLLLTMSDKGVPMQMVRWLRRFLENRQVKVRFCDAMSGTRKMRQGLPQGAVLSPTLFLFYINEVASILPTSTVSSLFADDISALGTNKCREKPAQQVQETVPTLLP